MTQKTNKSAQTEIVNAALLNISQKPQFLRDALVHAAKVSNAIVITDSEDFLPELKKAQRINFAAASLDQAPIEHGKVIAKIEPFLDDKFKTLIVDMRWTVANLEGVTSLERWGSFVEKLAEKKGASVFSIYDRDLLIEEQMQTVFLIHRQFLAPAGLRANPYWIPTNIIETGTLDEQLDFMLGQIMPEYLELGAKQKSGDMFARGATPSWLERPKVAIAAGTSNQRWHIHCFGALRVFIAGQSVEWRLAGSTPRKTRTLFAYLLQSGEKGAHADQMSELLWPEETSEETKRARLHHTIAMLRKTLGTANSVLRTGDYYRLNPPAGSWIDIDTFEQLCRRGLSLFKRGELAAALQLFFAGDQLYSGDLFEDLPRDYTEPDQENWCVPKRIWLREMALKLQTDLARTLVLMGRTREALEHTMKALAIDPASETANAEAMRIFEMQGRNEAIHRQYRQYVQASSTMGAVGNREMQQLYSKLTTKKST